MILRYSLWISLFLLCAFFGVLVFQRTKSAPSGLLSAWVLASAANVIFLPQVILSLTELRLKLVAGRSFALTSMMVLFAICLTPRGAIWTIRALLVSGLINCGLLLGLGYGLFNASTMDGTFIAMMLPLYICSGLPLAWGFFFAGVPVLTLIIADTGSTAFFVVATQIAAYLVVTKRWFWILPSILAILGIGYWREGFNLYYSPDRTNVWKPIMEWWWSNANIWTGTGTGTFQWLGPLVQNRPDNLFTWMHNDWLQIIFEQGIVGIALTAWLLASCLMKARNRPWLVAAIGGTCFAMVTQFPLRFPLSILFVLVLIHISLKGEEA